jgi:hypothetical protein
MEKREARGGRLLIGTALIFGLGAAGAGAEVVYHGYKSYQAEQLADTEHDYGDALHDLGQAENELGDAVMAAGFGLISAFVALSAGSMYSERRSLVHNGSKEPTNSIQ